MDRLAFDTELRNTLINSALKTNADNPQDFSADWYDTIVKILEMYRGFKITDAEISFLAERLHSWFNFQLTSDEIEKRVAWILALHEKYLGSLVPESRSRIYDWLSRVISQTIWNSAEGAKSVIEGKIWFLGQCTELEAGMWKVIYGNICNIINVPTDKLERIDFALEKLKAQIEERRTWVETRRQRYSH